MLTFAQNGWLTAFLKIYIKVLQQASDLDDTVEEKLLIGDRPKQSSDPKKWLPLKDRLLTQDPDELTEVRKTSLCLGKLMIFSSLRTNNYW